jgi:voltage-gated potassium channel
MRFDRRQISRLIGAAGVAPEENLLARRVGVIFEVPMLMAAAWILLNWWAERQGILEPGRAGLYDILLWGLFVLETSVLSLLVRHTGRYLESNWLNLVIILLGIPLLLGWDVHLGALRLLRLLIILSLFLHVGSGARKMLTRNEVGTALITSLIVIVMAGAMMAVLDPGIGTPWDGIWWAWVTVTTVGYGDVVPVTHVGRIFGSFVILLGIALFSMLTAAFAAHFLSRGEQDLYREEKATYHRLDDMDARLRRMEAKLDRMSARLDDESPKRP